MNMENQLKGNNKDTRTISLTSFWCHYCQLDKHFTSYPVVFSVSIADLEQAKSRLGSKRHRSKKLVVILLLFVRNI